MTTQSIYEQLYQQAKDFEAYYESQGHHGSKMYLPGVELAKVIRFELKRKFPGHKFSVTVPHGGIRVNWTDGPNLKQVQKITGPLEGKGFDGSIDLEYYYRHVITPSGIVKSTL